MGAQRETGAHFPHHLIFIIWAATQHYADFAPQVEAVTGATLRDEAFLTKRSKAFSALLLKGFACVNRLAAVGSSNHPLHIAAARLKTLRVRSFYRSGTGWRSWVARCRPPYLSESERNRRPAVQSMPPALLQQLALRRLRTLNRALIGFVQLFICRRYCAAAQRFISSCVLALAHSSANA